MTKTITLSDYTVCLHEEILKTEGRMNAHDIVDEHVLWARESLRLQELKYEFLDIVSAAIQEQI